MSSPDLPRRAAGRGGVSSDRKQKAFYSAKDYETSASQIGDIEPIAPSNKRKVALLVANNVPKEEVLGILEMLGIAPGQPDWDDGPIITPSLTFNPNSPKED